MKYRATVIYLLKKLFKMVVTVFVVTTIIFFLIRLMPSNPVQQYIVEQMVQYGMTYEDAQTRAAFLFSMDLDKPLLIQYIEYLGNVARLDFGDSLLSPGVSVMTIIANRLPWTLFTVGIGLVLSFIVGVAIGALMAFKRDKWYEPVISGIASFLSSIPDFLIAITLLLIFGVINWGGHGTIIPISMMRGNYSMGITPGWNFAFISDIFMHAALPILTYMLSQIGIWGSSDERLYYQLPEYGLCNRCKNQGPFVRKSTVFLYRKKRHAAHCDRVCNASWIYRWGRFDRGTAVRLSGNWSGASQCDKWKRLSFDARRIPYHEHCNCGLQFPRGSSLCRSRSTD